MPFLDGEVWDGSGWPGSSEGLNECWQRQWVMGLAGVTVLTNFTSGVQLVYCVHEEVASRPLEAGEYICSYICTCRRLVGCRNYDRSSHGGRVT